MFLNKFARSFRQTFPEITMTFVTYFTNNMLRLQMSVSSPMLFMYINPIHNLFLNIKLRLLGKEKGWTKTQGRSGVSIKVIRIIFEILHWFVAKYFKSIFKMKFTTHY